MACGTGASGSDVSVASWPQLAAVPPGAGGCRFLICGVDCIAELAWRLPHHRCRLGRVEEPEMQYLQCPCNCLGKETWCQIDTVFSVGPKTDPVACHCGAERRLWYR